jgi:TolA-binding protein
MPPKKALVLRAAL